MIEFDIEKYLNSLSDKVEKINVSNKKLKYLPELSRFKCLKYLKCSNNQLTSLPILPDNLECLDCHSNNLTILPILKKKLISLDCSYNIITSLPVLNKNLIELFCANNKLTSLPVLNKELKILYCISNDLTSFPVLNENLKHCYYSNNPISSIIYNNNFNIFKKNIKIWNNFRYLYYCLKYRKKFLKIMEPIIKKRYHPSYLYNLTEEDDLDEKLEKW
uniref:Leucine-rich repeat protein n=1 Tax=viral metagenome TaxID=1070528 RepID=A0A6C0H5W5_9ZZZZ